MDPADIDWKRVEWRFVRDDLYEHFNAPKWVDLSAPSPRGRHLPSTIPADEAWFCRPNCHHPKTAEDFLRWRSSPPSGQSKVKLVKALSSPLGERNPNNNSNTHRDANLKRRGGGLPLTRESPKSKPPEAKKKFRADLENQDPNLSASTPGRVAKIAKETIKSSAQRQEPRLAPERPLRSTLSARNLFAGKEILTQISELCNEIKRLAMSRSERTRGGAAGSEEGDTGDKKKEVASGERVEEPLLENIKKDESIKKKKKRWLDTGGKVGMEKPPEPRNGRENVTSLQEVRSCPPTPQRFPSPLSAHWKATTPVKSSSRPGPPAFICEADQERGILRELVHHKEETQALVGKEDGDDDNTTASSPAGAEGKSVDLFWFLKPCAYLGVR